MADEAAGDRQDWERFSKYLNLLARTQVGRQLQGKLDLSGVVQQTLLEAHQAAEKFRGQTDEQKAAWLRRILANNLADDLRRLRADKRDVTRERSLEAAIDQSSSRVNAWLIAEQSSPSQQAIRHEESLRLADALAELPDAEQQVIELHHFGGLSLAEIGRELGRTKSAAAGLLQRGLKRLRDLMTED